MAGYALDINEIRDWVPHKAYKAPPGVGLISEICFDSRRIFRPGQAMFVALTGPQRDGHRFIAAAAARGVRFFLVSSLEAVPEDCGYLLVEDSLAALQTLAAKRRSQFRCPVIAITGSNGKTIVKEWLSDILSGYLQLEKSPGSYNSQLGVPLSVLGMNPQTELGIFEAGISRPGEMDKLRDIIRPDIGIFTHFGDAHDEGFPDPETKLGEKLKLFRDCEVVVAWGDDEELHKKLVKSGLSFAFVGTGKGCEFQLSHIHPTAEGWTFRGEIAGESAEFDVPVSGQAALENAALAILAAKKQKPDLSLTDIAARVAQLNPVSMRMEMITDNPEITVINDAYNADLASIRNAFSIVARETNQPGKALILSDVQHQGTDQEKVQRQVLQDAERVFLPENIYLIGPMYAAMARESGFSQAWPDTDSFLRDFEYEKFRGKVVLLKGARTYELEKLIPFLSRQASVTYFRINLDYLSANYRYFRKEVPRPVRLMAMVKAFAYGSGSWEIAQALEAEGVDYFAVAYTSEGIQLRTSGIRTPIMVMNPDEDSLEQLYHFDLEPEVYNLSFLQRYAATGLRLGRERFPLHLKTDTGMARLGFSWQAPHALLRFLEQQPGVEVLSVLSHLSSADEPAADAFTRQQVMRFQQFAEAVTAKVKVPPMRHILNTAGALRFPEYNFDMVRVGIGLYGVSPIGAEGPLREIGSLHSAISQIHEFEAGARIGYGGSDITQRQSRIATVPVGYADGIRRSLGNGRIGFLVRGQRAPTIGRICMDMLMLDVTDIPGAREGDEVVLFGEQGKSFISVRELADRCDTIPYEILTGIGRRVRRLYVRD